MADLPVGRQGARTLILMKRYFLYITRSKSTGRFYTGMTNDLQRRLKQHNRLTSNTLATRKLTDFEIVYKEMQQSRAEARKVESFVTKL